MKKINQHQTLNISETLEMYTAADTLVRMLERTLTPSSQIDPRILSLKLPPCQPHMVNIQSNTSKKCVPLLPTTDEALTIEDSFNSEASNTYELIEMFSTAQVLVSLSAQKPNTSLNDQHHLTHQTLNTPQEEMIQPVNTQRRLKRFKNVDPVTGEPSKELNSIPKSTFKNRQKVDPITGLLSQSKDAISRNSFYKRKLVNPLTGQASNDDNAITKHVYNNLRFRKNKALRNKG